MTHARLLMRNVVWAAFFMTVAGCLLAQEAHALFDLQVTPRRGGTQIRFEEAKPGQLPRNEEVTVTITSDVAAQYRFYQTVFEPLTNEQGNVIPQGALVLFSPSNPLGTLRTQLEAPVTMGEMPIYTSNAAGDSDEFVLVFNVRIPESQPGGLYRCRISFTAEPINAQAGVSSKIVTLAIEVQITPSFRLAVTSPAGGRDLRLGTISKDRPVARQSLTVQVDSNIASAYRIVQKMSEPLISPEGALFDDEGIVCTILGGEKGTVHPGPRSALSVSPTIIYTSTDAGAGDAMQLQFESTPDALKRAGVYSGVLSLSVESTSPYVSPEIIQVPVRIEVDSVFYLDVEFDSGGQFNFGTFKTGEEKQQRSATLTIHSNLGKPYQVSQILSRKLTNPEGAAIPKEHFQFFGSDAKTGRLSFLSPTPIEEGETLVFTSDKLGTPEKFSLNYILTVPKDARAGTYNSETKYSLTET